MSHIAHRPTTYPCPLCGQRERRPIRSVPGFGRCVCGLVCNDREDPPEDYGEGYFTSEEPGKGHRDFGSSSAREYDERRFGAELRMLGRPTAGARLLDIGSATGSYLAMAAGHGWDGIGVEVSAGARALARSRGVESRPDLDDVSDLAPFALVTMHHVLEHLVDPVGTLTRVAGLLGPGGRVLIEVPNWRSLERRAMGSHWMDLRPEQHRWHFEPETLQRACRAAGLRVQATKAPGEPVPSPTSVLRSLGVPDGWRPGPNLRAPVPTGGGEAEGGSGTDGEPGPGPFPVIAATARVTDALGSRLLVGKRLVVIASTGK